MRKRLRKLNFCATLYFKDNELPIITAQVTGIQYET